MVLVCLFLLDKEWRRKIFFGVTMVLSIYSVIFLFSRGGYAAILLGLAFIGSFKNRKLLVLLIVFLLTWKMLLPTAVIERVEMSLNEEESGEATYDRSIETRLDLWEGARDIISQNPIAGLGYGVLAIVKIHEEVGDRNRSSIHNGYLEIMAELGLIGLIIFLTFFGISFKAGLRLYKIADDPFMKGLGFGFCACVVAVLAGNMAGTYWHYLNVSGFYWVFLALVVRGTLIAQKQSSKIKEPDRTTERLYWRTPNQDFRNRRRSVRPSRKSV